MANEKRLIDANALQEHIGDCFGYPAVDILHEIAIFPTVDAVEVVHGKWTPNFEYDFDRGEHRLVGYHCDQCGIWTLHKSNYCPNCGAKMDGDGK